MYLYINCYIISSCKHYTQCPAGQGAAWGVTAQGGRVFISWDLGVTRARGSEGWGGAAPGKSGLQLSPQQERGGAVPSGADPRVRQGTRERAMWPSSPVTPHLHDPEGQGSWLCSGRLAGCPGNPKPQSGSGLCPHSLVAPTPGGHVTSSWLPITPGPGKPGLVCSVLHVGPPAHTMVQMPQNA